MGERVTGADVRVVERRPVGPQEVACRRCAADDARKRDEPHPTDWAAAEHECPTIDVRMAPAPGSIGRMLEVAPGVVERVVLADTPQPVAHQWPPRHPTRGETTEAPDGHRVNFTDGEAAAACPCAPDVMTPRPGTLPRGVTTLVIHRDLRDEPDR